MNIDLEIPCREAAILICKSERQLQRQVADGYIPRATRGLYVIRDVVSGNLKSVKAEAERRNSVARQGKVSDARARLLELKIAKEERELINLAEALEMLERGLRGFLSILTSLPGRISPDDRAERTRITGLIDVAREEMAAVFEGRAAELRTGTG